VEARVGQVLRFEPYADHLQFVVSDAEADWCQLDGDTWVKAPTEWRIGVERHAIAVATARYDYVPVIFELLDRAPADAVPDDVGHAVEADIEVLSGGLTIAGPTQQPKEANLLQLEPGRYRLRISYAPTDYRPAGSTDAEPGDYLEYQIMMWPVQVPSDVQVLRQGPSPWAY
jgi:hypothetical protein